MYQHFGMIQTLCARLHGWSEQTKRNSIGLTAWFLRIYRNIQCKSKKFQPKKVNIIAEIKSCAVFLTR